jgi:hypothetical protein
VWLVRDTQEQMKLGNIFYQANGNVRIGFISYVSHRCSIGLTGWRAGLVCCLPFSADAPFIEGKIVYGHGKKRQEIGRIYTESDQRGPAYMLIFDVDPWDAWLAREQTRMLRDNYKAPRCLWLTVELEDKEP